MMILKIAWRNIKRNKKRSIVTVILSAICTALLIYSVSINDGAHHKMIRDSVEIYTGYIQIVGKEFNEYPDYDHLIFDEYNTIKSIENIREIDTYASRLETFALLSGKDESVGGKFVGIQPEKEKEIARFTKTMTQGRYLTKDDTSKVIIGEELAKKLDVKIGDTITYLSTAIDYSIAADIVTVVGIFKTNLFDFDENMVFANKPYVQELFYAENVASHIVIKPKNKKAVTKTVRMINKNIDNKKYDVLPWDETLPGVKQAVALDDAFSYIFYIIIVVVIFFVIMIFSLLNIYQRNKEIGIVKSLGTTPKQIFHMLFAESVILGFFSLLVGGVLGIGASVINMIYPYNLEKFAEAYSQWGITDPTIYPEITLKAILAGICAVIFMNLISILYPIWKINKLKPVDAIHGKGLS
ncbi:ABC transporter permease [Candidatus Margulisiibacteriota bacterium]